VLMKGAYPMNKMLSELRSLKRRLAGVTLPIGRKRIKWYRNWLCLCGSGKRYKRCCLSEIASLTALDGNATVRRLPGEIQSMIDDQRNLGVGTTVNFVTGPDGKVGIRNNG
jgi:hypothetical protein